MKKFNYCIGSYWNQEKDDAVSTYAYGSEVKFGSLKDAKKMLAYVQKKSPDDKWKIFMVTEIPE